MQLSADVPLAPLTTLELGGPARHFVRATGEDDVREACAWAAAHGVPLAVLGGGSNVVVADAGFPGLVLAVALRGARFEAEPGGARVLLHAAAGEPWDALVDAAVARELAGVECLAGIPGLAGGTPIQNVGAYGQEVSDTIVVVRAFDRARAEIVALDAAACEFGYRDSFFKRQPDRYVVLGVTFALVPGGAPQLRYPELAAALAADDADADAAPAVPPSLARVAAAVRALRRRKSMVLDPADPNRRSAGSFFTNPVLSEPAAEALVERALRAGLVAHRSGVPRFPGPAPGSVKIPAAWLIEHAGFPKGTRRGAVGTSSKHALALVHHGGGTTAELLALAAEIAAAVADRFGVPLALEPTLLPAAP